MSSVRLEVNVQRDARGIPTVVPSAVLRVSAGQMARWLAHHGRLEHRRRKNGTEWIRADARWWWLGEVLEEGAHTPVEVVARWMASPPHRKILLSRRARSIGVARRGDLWVAHFGALGP